ncbi:endoglucanase [Mycolicibacterium novocastrense]|uniref:Endoglucanase n=1 Tax=Mycolicibacterium novocastrense TaxID=59813 RepID=A0ABQ0KN19_MYCNV|nr:endoglucanase [Mycolicibacterium novocastrense]
MLSAGWAAEPASDWVAPENDCATGFLTVEIRDGDLLLCYGLPHSNRGRRE